MNIAELFIKCLEEEGVKYIFGVPGEENEDFLFALSKSSITFVPTRHEQGAAFIANLWGRVTGNAGVCLSTLGPGATNLITGIADAYLDKSPVVAITGQGSLDRLHHESHQIIDIVKMFSSITKWNASIKHPSIVPEVVRKAFKIAQAEKPGTTHIELPEDIASNKATDSLFPLKSKLVRRPSPDDKAIHTALKTLINAKKPIIIAGNGAIRTRASKALTNLSTSCNIPIATTFMGKGAISDKECTSVGTIGLGFKDYIIEACEEADVILTVGYDIAEYDPQMWNQENHKKIIHLDFVIAETYQHYIPYVEIIGDLAAGLQMINEGLKDCHYASWYTDIKNRISKSILSFKLNDESTTFNAPGVISAVREVLPDSGLLISDVGSHKMWIARNFPTYCANGCIISNGLASMGIALPGGIGAKLANPERAVVSLMGDGGAMMNIQEMETAKRLGIGFTIIILNDNNYGLIDWKQTMHTGKSFGTKIDNPNFVKLAESFGINGYKPKSVSELKKILGKTLTSNELAVIEIPIKTDVNQQLIEELNQYFK